MVTATTSQIKGIWAASPTDVFAVDYGGKITHWDGAEWAQQSSPPANYNAIWGAGPDDVFAVAVSKKEEVFVGGLTDGSLGSDTKPGGSDGFVAKYDKNGRFIKSFGTRGNGPGQMNTPHGIAVDAKGNAVMEFNSPGMFRGVRDSRGRRETAIYDK